jgi:Na+/melibiose symporter-like transporter
MLAMNKQQPPELTADEIEALSRNQIRKVSTFKESCRYIFSKRTRFTLQIALSWFVFGFEMYGIMFLMPLEFSRTTSMPLIFILIITVVQVGAVAFGARLVENRWFGRKNFMIVSQAVTTIAIVILLFLMMNSPIASVVFIAIGLVATNIKSLVSYPFMTEMYPTHVRGTASSMAGFTCRIASIIAPALTVGTWKISP